MKPVLRRLLPRLIGPAIFIALFWRYLDSVQILQHLEEARLAYLALALGLIPAIALVRGLRWKWILEAFSINLPYVKCYKISLLATFASSALPLAGNFLKIFYLPKPDFGLSRPLLSIFMEKYLDTVMPLAFGTAGLLVMLTHSNPVLSIPATLLFLSGLFILCRAQLLFFRGDLAQRFFRYLLSNRLAPEHLGAHLRDLSHACNGRTYGATVLEFIIASNLTMYFFLRTMGVEPDLASLLLIASVNSAAAVVPISYLGVGVRDLLLIGVYRLFDGTSEAAVALSMIILTYHLVGCICGAFLWFAEPLPIKAYKEGFGDKDG